MTNTVKHTATPWKYDGDGFDSVAAQDFGTDGYTVMTEDCDAICEICDTGDDNISQANAAHIVKCVNAHDALVEALMELINEVEHGDADGVIAAVDKGYSALKLAGAA